MNREQNRLHAVGMNRMNVKNHNDSCNSSKVKQEAEKCGRYGAREREMLTHLLFVSFCEERAISCGNTSINAIDPLDKE